MSKNQWASIFFMIGCVLLGAGAVEAFHNMMVADLIGAFGVMFTILAVVRRRT